MAQQQQRGGPREGRQPKPPWLQCTGCGGHNPPDKPYCGDCQAPKTDRWPAVLLRGETKGKGKGKGGKGKSETVNKGKGKGKCPSYRRPQPSQLGDWVQVVRGSAGGQPSASQPAGADKSATEKRLAAEVAALQRKLAEAHKAVASPAAAPEDVPVEEEAVDDWLCGVCGKS